MADWSDLFTDESLADLTKRLHGVYKQASDELEVKAADYFERYSERYVEQYQAYQDGKYTKQQWQEWQRAQMGRGKRWDKLRDDMADRMVQANKVATGYMNDTFTSVFCENYNYSAYIIEDYNRKYGDAYQNIDFSLLDENTVKRLSASKELTMLPPKARIDYTKDEEWNKRKIQNSLLQGILQGESIDKMAKRLALDVGHMNEVQAVRAARTMCTEAQNAGRQANYDYAESLGIDMLKEWMSAADDRVRESHAELDGVRVKVKDLFPNGLEMPGDHRGDPAEVYNCRCTMRAVFPRYDSGKNKRYSAVPGHQGYHDRDGYFQWKAEKTGGTVDAMKAKLKDLEIQYGLRAPERTQEEILASMTPAERVKAVTTPAERDASEIYLAHAGFDMNDLLRGKIPAGGQDYIDELQGYIKDFDSLLSKVETEKAMTVYRGFSLKDTLKAKGMSQDAIKRTMSDPNMWLRNGRFVEKGYVSTAIDKSIAEQYAKDAVLVLKVPKGTHAIMQEYISPDGAGELTIHRGMAYEITKIEKKNGKFFVYAKYVKQRARR